MVNTTADGCPTNCKAHGEVSLTVLGSSLASESCTNTTVSLGHGMLPSSSPPSDVLVLLAERVALPGPTPNPQAAKCLTAPGPAGCLRTRPCGLLRTYHPRPAGRPKSPCPNRSLMGASWGWRTGSRVPASGRGEVKAAKSAPGPSLQEGRQPADSPRAGCACFLSGSSSWGAAP
jgi:hypothetical protein